MNKSHLAHAIIGLFFQAVLVLLTGSWWAGVIFCAGWFVSREHMDMQRGIVADLKRTGEPTSVDDLWPWEGLNITEWSTDSRLDVVSGVVPTVLLALVLG